MASLSEELGLRADSAGFLIGQPTDLSAERDRLTLLRAIKADTARIAAAVTSSVARQETARVRSVASRAATRTRTRTSDAANNARFDQAPSPVARRRAQPERAAGSSNATATPRRDGSGRFVKGSGAGGNGPGSASDGESNDVAARSIGALGVVASKLRDSVGGLLSRNEQVDPAIAAAREVGDIVAPLTRPLGGLGRMLFGSRGKEVEQAEKKVAVPWFKKLDKKLGDIKERIGGSRAGGLLSRIGGALGKIPGVKMLGGLVGKGAGLLGGLLGMGGRALGKGGKLLGGLGKGLLRRIPLIGALFSGGSALASIFGVGNQTRDERFKGAGGGIGALIGGGIGMLAGPVGAVVGGMLGDLVGTKVGEWLSTVNWAEIGASISGAWAGLTDKIGAGWDWVQTKFGGMLDSAAAVFSDSRKWIAEKVGAVAGAVKPYADKAFEVAKPYVDKAKKTAAPYVDEVAESTSTAKNWLMSKLDSTYRGKGTFKGVAGGAALETYGSYTPDEASRIRKLKTSGANTSGRMPGGMPADIRTKIIAQAQAYGLDPNDMLDMANIESGGNPNAISSTGAIGVYQFTGKTATGVGMTDRFDVDQNIQGGMKLAVENAKALTRAGLPVNRDSLYMLHQLGPTAAIELLRGAADGKRMDQMSKLTQNSAALNIGKGSVTAAEYLATNSRALDARLGKVSSLVPATLAAQSAATARVPTVPYTAQVAPPTDRQTAQAAPKVAVPLASNDRKGVQSVVLEQPLTQNVENRGLAQAATGGIGMGLGGR